MTSRGSFEHAPPWALFNVRVIAGKTASQSK